MPRATRDIELGARHAARVYIRQARDAGHDWDQIGHILGVAAGADIDQAGLAVAEAAYTYAAGSPIPTPRSGTAGPLSGGAAPATRRSATGA